MSLTNSFNHFLYKVITLAFTTLFGVYSVTGGLCKEPPEVPEDFTPVLRFAVCSDIHLDGTPDQNNAKRFADLFKNSYKYSEEHATYNNLDAVMVCGDMTDEGTPEQLKRYATIIDENIKDGTTMLQCLGNHEFIHERNNEGVNTIENYKNIVSETINTHEVINGYHFIGVSYADKSENFDDHLKWLDEQLKIATKEDKNKPVFVFQHPHATLTVYGSIHWGDIGIRSVLEKYPQVVDFSGHSHYASVDPRTVWQGSFTAIGTGSIYGLMGNRNYLTGDQYSQFWTGSYNLVEVDADGNIRMLIYDCVSKQYFSNIDYYFKNPTKLTNRVYNWANMYSLDTKPQFPENSVITSELTDEGETKIVFPRAKGYFEAESYKVTIQKDNKNVYEDTLISNYILASDKDMWVNVGVLEEGTYKVTVKPSSPYARQGKTLKGEITVK